MFGQLFVNLVGAFVLDLVSNEVYSVVETYNKVCLVISLIKQSFSHKIICETFSQQCVVSQNKASLFVNIDCK